MNYVGYKLLKGNVSPGCSSKYPELCKLTPSNSYERGCNAGEKKMIL